MAVDGEALGARESAASPSDTVRPRRAGSGSSAAGSVDDAASSVVPQPVSVSSPTAARSKHAGQRLRGASTGKQDPHSGQVIGSGMVGSPPRLGHGPYQGEKPFRRFVTGRRRNSGREGGEQVGNL